MSQHSVPKPREEKKKKTATCSVFLFLFFFFSNQTSLLLPCLCSQATPFFHLYKVCHRNWVIVPFFAGDCEFCLISTNWLILSGSAYYRALFLLLQPLHCALSLVLKTIAFALPCKQQISFFWWNLLDCFEFGSKKLTNIAFPYYLQH